MDTTLFQEHIWRQGALHYRSMPWRDEPTFYNVLVSEVMLQQTQVSRVKEKFALFIDTFPNINTLANAPLSDVLVVWQGLGYNRRAKFLHEAAKQVVKLGEPATLDEMVKLPGIGVNTAGAIMNYVYERPTPFIETNIRSVYFEHFFSDRTDVSDKELLSVVRDTLDQEHPRDWFYALMDYGTYLKSIGRGRLSQSKHYKKQPPLKGSIREVRGYILAELSKGPLQHDALAARRSEFDDRFNQALEGLIDEGLVSEAQGLLKLTD